MKAPSAKTLVGVGVLCCFIIAGVYFLLTSNPYARLERVGKRAARLSRMGAAPSLSDNLIGVLHRSDPRRYFVEEARKEQEELLAAGLLVETSIPIRADCPADDVVKSLRKEYQQTGAYWTAVVDTSNSVVVLISKPEDAASFVAAFTSHEAQ